LVLILQLFFRRLCVKSAWTEYIQYSD